MRKKKPTTEEIILGIRSSDEYIAIYIYKQVFPMVKGYILHNSGDENQALDLFQDAYISLHTKFAQVDICIECEFSTYFYSYCKNMWLKKLSQKKDIMIK